MAKVKITIKDDKEGGIVDIKVNAEPAFPSKAKDFTPAQQLAGHVVSLLDTLRIGGDDEDDEEDK